ncbi:MAG: alkaline phosphatase family protein [Thermoanaerobaculaceae bacterium]
MQRAWILTILALQTACVVNHPEKPPNRLSRRVVLVSFDGLAAERHRRLVKERRYLDPEGLAAFHATGFAAEATPPNPTLTAVVHATIATGRLPQGHGIVANRFHLPGSPAGATVSGFEQPWEAPSLWETLGSRGGKVGVITFPGCDGTSPRRSADFFMVYNNRPHAPARFTVLEPREQQEESWDFSLEVELQLSGTLKKVTFPIRARAPRKAGGSWELQVGSGNRGGREVSVADWFPLTVTVPHGDGGQQTVGAWCLVKEIRGLPPKLVLYQGAFYSLDAKPRAFRELVEREAGFWPGPPDDQALAEGLQGRVGLSLSEYGQQLERFASFFTAATRAAIEHMDFDLLLAYQPVVDEAQHALTVTDPRQPNYTEGLSATASEFLDWTYLLADRAVGQLARALDLSQDTLVVVSDHGIHPVWLQANLQTWLLKEGLCPVQPGQPLSPQCELWAVQGGGVAHLYLNLEDPDPTGVSTKARTLRLLLQASEGLSHLEVAGEGLVEAMAPKEGLQVWGLAHSHSGDLVVFPKPGIVFGGRPGEPLYGPPPYAGAHGFLNHHPSMAAVFLARGAGVPPKVAAKQNLTEVAPFVLKLLGAHE